MKPAEGMDCVESQAPDTVDLGHDAIAVPCMRPAPLQLNNTAPLAWDPSRRRVILLNGAQGDQLDLLAAELDLKLIPGLQT